MVNTENVELFMTALGLPFCQQYQSRFRAFCGDLFKEREIGFCIPIRVLMCGFLSHIRDGLIPRHDQSSGLAINIWRIFPTESGVRW
jgi:hypothetical protein